MRAGDGQPGGVPGGERGAGEGAPRRRRRRRGPWGARPRGCNRGRRRPAPWPGAAAAGAAPPGSKGPRPAARCPRARGVPAAARPRRAPLPAWRRRSCQNGGEREGERGERHRARRWSSCRCLKWLPGGGRAAGQSRRARGWLLAGHRPGAARRGAAGTAAAARLARGAEQWQRAGSATKWLRLASAPGSPGVARAAPRESGRAGGGCPRGSASPAGKNQPARRLRARGRRGKKGGKGGEKRGERRRAAGGRADGLAAVTAFGSWHPPANPGAAKEERRRLWGGRRRRRLEEWEERGVGGAGGRWVAKAFGAARGGVQAAAGAVAVPHGATRCHVEPGRQSSERGQLVVAKVERDLGGSAGAAPLERDLGGSADAAPLERDLGVPADAAPGPWRRQDEVPWGGKGDARWGSSGSWQRLEG